MAMIKLLEYTFDNTIDNNCLPTFTGVGTTEVVDEVSGSVTKRIINVEENGLPTSISFSNKTALTELLYANTSNVNNMYKFFYNCTSLISVDLSNSDSRNVTTMMDLFSECINLKSINFSNFDTSKVTNMSYMFNNCKKLTSLDLSNFDTSNVTNMQCMFNNCNTLTSLDLSNFDTSKVTNMSYMFRGCSSLTSLDLSNFDTSKVTNMQCMFYDCQSLLSLDVTNFNTSNVIDMLGLFSGCSKITTLNLSNFITSSVTTMRGLFGRCNSLTSLDLSSFDTSKVTTMAYMFDYCNSLTSLNLSSFDTSKVTTMEDMFYNCSSLTSLDLSNFDTSNVTNFYRMFQNCSSLTSLDLSNFDASKVTNMLYMFQNCSSLTSLDLSNFDMANVTNTTNMFANCNKLTNIGLLYSSPTTINTIASLLPTTTSKKIYYQDAIPSELTPVNNVNFIEYKSNTVTTNEIVLRSLPNGVCDTLDLETGEYVQRIGEVVLDGSEEWEKRGNTNSFWTYNGLDNLHCVNSQTTINCLCDMMESKTFKYAFDSTAIPNSNVGVVGCTGNKIAISFGSTTSKTLEQFKQELSLKPITVQYELETPITTTIDLKQHPYAYKDGYINLSSNSEKSLTPTIEYSLIANRLGQIQSNQKLVEKQQAQINELESMVITNLVNTQYQQALNEIKLGVK